MPVAYSLMGNFNNIVETALQKTEGHTDSEEGTIYLKHKKQKQCNV